MNFLFDAKPIIALSSSTSSNSAIGVIRISGFSKIDIFQKVFKRPLSNLTPRYSYFTSLVSPVTQELIDEITFIFFEAPNSYNGENILEINCHGNQIIIQNIIELFLSNFELRHAKAGEFTYRAMVNNKLSLTQVEGLDLLLNANSPQVLKVGQSSFKGTLHKSYLELHTLLQKLKSSVDMALDFSEDIGDDQSSAMFTESFYNLAKFVSNLYSRTENSYSALLNPSIVLFGPPNAGKSTLFNYLLSEERSIVSATKGTTRDYISEMISISQVLFRLIDTAGLRETVDEIEKVGIEHTNLQVKDAFFSLRIIDFEEFQSENSYSEFDLVVVTHMDKSKYSSLVKTFPGNIVFTNLVGPMGPNMFGPIGPNSKSGPIGPQLKEIIYNRVYRKYADIFTKEPILIDRQRLVIRELNNYFVEYEQEIRSCNDHGILSFHINKINLLSEELVGIITPDEVLTSIFDNFCIGK